MGLLDRCGSLVGRATVCVVFGTCLLMRSPGAFADECGDMADRAVVAAGFDYAARPAWQRRVRASALLPTVRARAWHQTGGGQYWPSSEATSDWSYRSGHQTRISLDLEWDLANLVWHKDEVTLSREILRVREKRSDLVAEVLQLCLEHQRLSREAAAADPLVRSALLLARDRLAAQLIAKGAL